MLFVLFSDNCIVLPCLGLSDMAVSGDGRLDSLLAYSGTSAVHVMNRCACKRYV